MVFVGENEASKIYFASMQDSPKRTILSALFRSLRPLARFLLKAGIGYREFAEMSKCAFVDVSTKDYGLRGRPTNISRVAVMTGLTRKEVKRIREKITSGLEYVGIREVPPASILHHWHTDQDFIQSNGRPKTLPFDGPDESFSALVRKYGGDIPPGAMRTELKRVEAIEEDGDGNLVPLKKVFRPVEQSEQIERGLSQPLRGLALALNHNVGTEMSEAWVERVAYSSKIRKADGPRVSRIAQDRAAEFVESVNDIFSAYETIYSEDELDGEELVIGVGVYYFEDSPKAS